MNLGCKQCRREGEKLFMKGERCYSPKCAVIKKPYIPGVHGPKNQSRMSDYGRQLREKQKARRFYQISEKQFQNYYLEASKKSGNTSEILWSLLESRLDNVIRRSGLIKSLTGARQLVSHGMVEVNGSKVDIGSYSLKLNDEVEIKSEIDKINKQSLPKWLSIDSKSGKIKMIENPLATTGEAPFNLNLVIEFYSK